MSGFDQRDVLRRLAKAEAELARLRSQMMTPARPRGGGGGNSLWQYDSVDELLENTPGFGVKAGDFGQASIGECEESTFFECVTIVEGGGVIWVLLDEYVVDTKAEMDARTWSNGDRIRIAEIPFQQYLVVGGVPLPQEEFIATDKTTLDGWLGAGYMQDGSFARTTGDSIKAYIVIDGELKEIPGGKWTAYDGE